MGHVSWICPAQARKGNFGTGTDTAQAEPIEEAIRWITNGLNPGVLFDMDGTLMDTNYLHCLAWSRALRDAGSGRQ